MDPSFIFWKEPAGSSHGSTWFDLFFDLKPFFYHIKSLSIPIFDFWIKTGWLGAWFELVYLGSTLFVVCFRFQIYSKPVSVLFSEFPWKMHMFDYFNPDFEPEVALGDTLFFDRADAQESKLSFEYPNVEIHDGARCFRCKKPKIRNFGDQICTKNFEIFLLSLLI